MTNVLSKKHGNFQNVVIKNGEAVEWQLLTADNINFFAWLHNLQTMNESTFHHTNVLQYKREKLYTLHMLCMHFSTYTRLLHIIKLLFCLYFVI